jgi:hypothetical protein
MTLSMHRACYTRDKKTDAARPHVTCVVRHTLLALAYATLHSFT